MRDKQLISEETVQINEGYVALPLLKSLLFVGIGLVGLIIGGQLTVFGAKELAGILGISERIISLTIVAIGTSLPELISSIRAVNRGHIDIAIGNVVGSNIFNTFFVLGSSAVAGTILVGSGELRDMVVSLMSLVLLYILLFILNKNELSKVEGMIMIALYCGYIAYIVV